MPGVVTVVTVPGRGFVGYARWTPCNDAGVRIFGSGYWGENGTVCFVTNDI